MIFGSRRKSPDRHEDFPERSGKHSLDSCRDLGTQNLDPYRDLGIQSPNPHKDLGTQSLDPHCNLGTQKSRSAKRIRRFWHTKP